MSNPITAAEAHKLAILINTPTPIDFTERILGTLEHHHRCAGCATKVECTTDCALSPDSLMVCHWCDRITR